MTAPPAFPTTLAPDSKEFRAIRERALTDLFFFAGVVLGYVDLFPYEERTHLLLTRFLERRTGAPEIDEAPMQLALWPRTTGKSSIGTIARSLQLACRNPNTAILIANEKALTAQDFLATIKGHIERNELLRALFPEIVPPDLNDTTWSGSRATLARTTNRPEPTFDTIGAGGTVIGKHYDHIIVDDIISREAMENARAGSWIIMDQMSRWVNQLRPLLSNSAQPFPTILFLGTRWWHQDTYDHIEKAFSHQQEPLRILLHVKLSDGTTISREAERKGDLAIMRIAAIENGAEVFPKIWPMTELAKQREIDPELFACSLMNEPTNAAVRVFQDEWLRYWQWTQIGRDLVYTADDGSRRFLAASGIPKILVCDPAFTTTPYADRSALVVLGTDTERSKYLVLDAKAGKWEPRDLVIETLNLAKRWNVTRIFIEIVAQQAALLAHMKAEALTRNQAVSLEEVRPGGRNKDVRIEALSPAFKAGHLLVHSSQHDLLDEYRRFRPGVKRRDLLDALAYAVEKSPMYGRSPYGSATERSRAQLASYWARRDGRTLPQPQPTGVF